MSLAAADEEAACRAHNRELGVINDGPCVDMAGIVKGLAVGTYKFNKPEKAFLGEPFKFVMVLATAPDQNVDDPFKGTSGTLTEQTGRFAQSVEATLRGDDLKIEPSGPQARTATTVEPVVWDWSLTPQQGGKKRLTVEVVANIQVGADHHKVQVRTLYQEIDIEVSTFQRLKNYVTEANSLVLGAAAAVPALAALFGLVPKARDLVRNGWRRLRGRSSPNRADRRAEQGRRRRSV